MKLNRTGSRWDRNQRNNINDNWDEIERVSGRLTGIGEDASKTLGEAKRINTESKRVNKENISTNDRLDNIIADSGTSSTEVVDARGGHEVLSNRLNRYDYLVERPMLNNGKIILPSDFPEVPFNIYRKDKYNYSHDATPYNQFDWSDATEIFMTDDRRNSTDGTDYRRPIAASSFADNLENGVYGNQDTFIFTLVDNIWAASHAITIAVGVKNLLIRSASPQGKTFIGRAKRIGETLSEWQSYEGIYRATMTDGSNHPIKDVVNTNQNEWEFGIPSLYKSVNSISAVKNNRGTFYQNGNNIYCNPHKSESPRFLLPVTQQTLFTKKDSNLNIMFENIGFLNSTTNFSMGSIGINSIYWFGCIFIRGRTSDAFNISGGKYNAYLLDCVSAYGAKDGFNYHTTSKDSLAVEVNCVSFENGTYKPSGSQQTTHSNNGSTAHDGMNMLRVGSHYWNNEGPVVADVNDCYSISIGCKVGDIAETTTGSKSAFYLSGNTEALNPKYVIECMSYGDNIEVGINAPQGNTYFMDFEGHEDINGAEHLEGWF